MAELNEHKKVLLELLQEFDRVCRKNNIRYTLFCGTALGAVRHHGFIPWDDDLDVVLLREDYDKLLALPQSEWDGKYFFQKEHSEHWPLNFCKLRKNNTTCLEKFHPKDKLIHQGIYIDVFHADSAAESERVSKLQFYASRVPLAKALFKRGYETDSVLKKLFMGLCRILPEKPFLELAKGRKYQASPYVQTFLSCTSRYKKGMYRRKWFEETVDMEFEGLQVPVSAHYDELLTTLYGDYMTPPDEQGRKIKEHAILVDAEKNYTEYEHYRDGMKWDVHTRNIH